ncbi:hypothetical protein Q7L38_14920 [Pseudomonas protegens]|uniref:hypothetical protein n=1 Tax=Pseudomonas protegens TaxID=380021 RepID=UPI00276D5F02|nr:hypothetical protein [Pseudomonas protegens]MDP9533865.1 hypothetical protein [Pseudomonas protegens]
MTPSERMDITNGIWLCQTHSKLVDADKAAYPAERLRQIKAEHEDFLRGLITGDEARHGSDFIALGHDLVFTGELIGSDQRTWTFRLDHFVIGDLNTLIAFSERFETTQPYDLFILDNMLGEGRQLATPPAWRRTSKGYEVSVQVLPSFPRVQARELPLTLAIDEVNDIAVVNGSFARIRGLEALPQTIQQCLSTIRGEVFYDSSVGTRIYEYSSVFYDSPWLPKLIKLEAIRMACIPRHSLSGQTPHTPLWAVTRVHSVVRLDLQEASNWVPFRFVLQVEGVGLWERDIPLFIPIHDVSA